MDKAKDHQGMTGSEFQKDKHPSRPSSVLSNNSSKNQDVRFLLFYLRRFKGIREKFLNILLKNPDSKPETV